MNFIPLSSSSAGNAYLVTSPGVAPLLIEAGIPIKKLREKLWTQGVSLSDLAGCLVSHEHGDHSKTVDDLLRMGVDVCMSRGTAEIMGWDGHHRWHCLEANKDFHIGSSWLIHPFALHHDAEEPLGFFIHPYHQDERLLFIPDTEFVHNRFEGVTILAIECNNVEEILSRNIVEGKVNTALGRRVRRNHMSLERVIAMIKANDLSRCREIWLLHLSDSNSDEARMVREVQEATGIVTRAAAS